MMGQRSVWIAAAALFLLGGCSDDETGDEPSPSASDQLDVLGWVPGSTGASDRGYSVALNANGDLNRNSLLLLQFCGERLGSCIHEPSIVEFERESVGTFPFDTFQCLCPGCGKRNFSPLVTSNDPDGSVDSGASTPIRGI